MAILGWILFGLVIGALAKLVMPGRDPGGIIVTNSDPTQPFFRALLKLATYRATRGW